MDLNFVYMATAGTVAAVNSLDPIFDDSATHFGRYCCYIPFNVGSWALPTSSPCWYRPMNWWKKSRGSRSLSLLIGKLIVSFAVWLVTSSCWNHMSSNFMSFNSGHKVVLAMELPDLYVCYGRLNGSEIFHTQFVIACLREFQLKIAVNALKVAVTESEFT